MKKWEYNFIFLSTSDPTEGFSALGYDGWELVAVHNGIGYFKREKVIRDPAREGPFMVPTRHVDPELMDNIGAGNRRPKGH